ncbi:MAG TPA: NADH-quinone oxidoreductase subunit C [Actinomycetota bacterium]|nr:NADH-quinone oxidoreductase subunit C [Actinomycetota bacterium]
MELVSGREWHDRARELHDGNWQLVDLTAIDRLRLIESDPRFEVVVQLVNHETKERMTLHVTAEGEPPTVASVTPIWPGANFFEREVYDLMGIVFDGHPNLIRIMLPEDWEGHPLRKDYGVGKVPIDFVPQPLIQIDAPGQSPRNDEAAIRLDRLGQAVVEGDQP